ncbi:hypothetical protein PC128_g19805 [Phytophthora cactorum]|nr:hypothetical protein PC128_g19805 [Phytophthora cactorum]
MRVRTILLAVTAAVLASASGASTFHLSKTASTDLEHSSVATQSAFKPQRRLRKHDSKVDLESDDEERANSTWLSDMLVGFKRMINKVDDMDDKAAEMIKGKTPVEAEKIYHNLVESLVPNLQVLERKGITPESLKNHAKFKDLSKNEAEYLEQFYKMYWETFPRLKNVET